MDLTHFRLQLSIGDGGFGSVYAVCKTSLPFQGRWFALKRMRKRFILENDGEEEAMHELHLLRTVSSPFLINAYYAFQVSPTNAHPDMRRRSAVLLLTIFAHPDVNGMSHAQTPMHTPDASVHNASLVLPIAGRKLLVPCHGVSTGG